MAEGNRWKELRQEVKVSREIEKLVTWGLTLAMDISHLNTMYINHRFKTLCDGGALWIIIL